MTCTTATHDAWKRDRATFIAHTEPLAETEDGLWRNCPRCCSTLLWCDEHDDETEAA